MKADTRRARLIMELRQGGVTDRDVLAAMERVPRDEFVPDFFKDRAWENTALPIGGGQTMSQPYMVAKMSELLSLDGGERVLDVGTGSGYHAAVLAELAKEVVTIERVPELATRARETLTAAGYDNVEVRTGDGTLGVPDRAPYDAIAVAAAAPVLPESLYEQLKIGGRMAVPVGGRANQRLELIVKSPEGPVVVRSVPCRFVPLVGKEGFSE